MDIGNSLGVGLSQGLRLNNKMKLSLKILQMNIGELNEFIDREMKDNILVRVERGPSYRDDEYDPYSTIFSNERSFYEVLYDQVAELRLSSTMRRICEYIVDNIDSRGYLSHWIIHPFTEVEFNEALEIVRSLEPKGVAADNLSQCLLLQLESNKIYERIIVKSHLDKVAKGQLSDIARSLDIDVERVKKAINVIRKLNPIPSKGYYVEDRKERLIPDAYIDIEYGKVSVRLNNEAIPKIHLEEIGRVSSNNQYSKYINRCRKQGEFILECVRQRQSTLEKVLKEVVEVQNGYFLKGKLKPLSLQDIGDRLEVHQSTISRAIRNRYISIEGVTIEIKSLFAKRYRPKKAGKVDITREYVKEVIYSILDNESGEKPYSDEVIVRLLSKKGIGISRRAVSKYREEMGIGSSRERKVV